jgi:hypothetical protein
MRTNPNLWHSTAAPAPTLLPRWKIRYRSIATGKHVDTCYTRAETQRAAVTAFQLACSKVPSGKDWEIATIQQVAG